MLRGLAATAMQEQRMQGARSQQCSWAGFARTQGLHTTAWLEPSAVLPDAAAPMQAECFDYLFEIAVKMRSMGIEASLAPSTGRLASAGDCKLWQHMSVKHVPATAARTCHAAASCPIALCIYRLLQHSTQAVCACDAAG